MCYFFSVLFWCLVGFFLNFFFFALLFEYWLPHHVLFSRFLLLLNNSFYLFTFLLLLLYLNYNVKIINIVTIYSGQCIQYDRSLVRNFFARASSIQLRDSHLTNKNIRNMCTWILFSFLCSFFFNSIYDNKIRLIATQSDNNTHRENVIFILLLFNNFCQRRYCIYYIYSVVLLALFTIIRVIPSIFVHYNIIIIIIFFCLSFVFFRFIVKIFVCSFVADLFALDKLLFALAILQHFQICVNNVYVSYCVCDFFYSRFFLYFFFSITTCRFLVRIIKN